MAGTIWETDNPAVLRKQIATRAAKAARTRLREMNVATSLEAAAWPPYMPPAGYDYCEPTGTKPRRTAKEIATEVARRHKYTLHDLMSSRRDHQLVLARQEAFWRCKQETPLSLPQIGRHLGGRDHTTVLYGIRRHEERLRQGNA